MNLDNVLLAFGLTLVAGLSTGIGSCIALFAKRTDTRFLSVALGFSAGVMIYVSMVDIFFTAQESLVNELGKSLGSWVTVISFFAGIALIALIDRLVPSEENPHEYRKVEEISGSKSVSGEIKLLRTGLFTALAITIHNFPEGIATFASAVKDPKLGLMIAAAIAIHNIPEGIAVSVPVHAATGSKKRAFWLSFLSGLSEPVGALIGFLFLRTFFTDTVFGILFAAVAGIMVFISLDELLPASREYGEAHLSIYGVIAGMAVMAISLLLFI
jgi:ZIP family zinc transporter